MVEGALWLFFFLFLLCDNPEVSEVPYLVMQSPRAVKENCVAVLLSSLGRVCMIGERIMSSSKVDLKDCYFNETTQKASDAIYDLYCNNNTDASDADPSDGCGYLKTHKPYRLKGIPGIASGVFMGKMGTFVGKQLETHKAFMFFSPTTLSLIRTVLLQLDGKGQPGFSTRKRPTD